MVLIHIVLKIPLVLTRACLDPPLKPEHTSLLFCVATMTDRSFNTECPVCLETLFDEKGVADKAVAEIMCLHLVHSDCLVEASRALNAGGQRYGVGGFGPRAGCPICEEPISSWRLFNEAGMFKAFWTTRIENALKQLESIGEDGRRQPVRGEQLRNLLKEDTSLTKEQKEMIRFSETGDDDSGYVKCLAHAGRVDYCVDQVIFSGFLFTRGIWRYDWSADTAWLWEWGVQTSSSSCSNCDSREPGLKLCSGCKDSAQAPMYCSKDCQRSDWKRHKKKCKTFQVMKQGGTREELLQRLSEL